MQKLREIGRALQEVLITAAERLARPSGFVQRASKMTGPRFVQSMVLGSLQTPVLHLRDLAQTAMLTGVSITNQGLDQRFSEASARLMRGVLDAVLSTVLSALLGESEQSTEQEAGAATPTLLERFTHVELIDSTVIALPPELAEAFPGCNSTQGSTAAMKLDVLFDIRTGQLRGPEIRPGRAHDSTAAIAQTLPAPGALRIQDLGYFALKRLKQISDAGAYWLTRAKGGIRIFDAQRQPIDLLQLLSHSDTLDCPVFIGREKLPARLLAYAVPESVAQERRRSLARKGRKHSRTPSAEARALCAWSILLTNVPSEMLSLQEARALLGARWQIELLFKLWKSDLQIDSCTSAKPWRVVTEIYAKLIAMTLQHWILQAGVWQIPDRSLRKAAVAVRTYALVLLRALARPTELLSVLQTMVDRMQVGCRLERRRGHPNVYQTLTQTNTVALA
jgi:hypothetical protein